MNARFGREKKLNKPRSLLPGLLDRVRGLWIDAASGDGVFAQALLELADPDTVVIAIDLVQAPLRRFREELADWRYRTMAIQADLASSLPIKQADGIVLANSLHFFSRRKKIEILNICQRALRPGGSLILVEYNSRRATAAVPYPIRFEDVPALMRNSGFRSPHKSSFVHSTYLGEMYAVLTHPKKT